MNPSNVPEDPVVTSGQHISYWTDSSQQQTQNPLQEHLETEVVIVGGGLGGITTAYCLLRAGKKVVLIEDGYLGSGETGRTTAHLVTALDDRYYDLERLFGNDETRLIASSHREAIDFVEQVVLSEKIDCEFKRVDGFLFLHPSDKHESIEKEFDAALRAGVAIDQVHEIPGMKIPSSGLKFSNQAQFHPLKYLLGLAEVIRKKGGKIYTGTHAAEIDHEGITTSDGFTVKAKHVVVATNSPVNNKFRIFAKEYPYRTYVIGALIKKGSVPYALWWDTGDFNADAEIPPYHYVRVQPYNSEYDLLISGGEDHPTGDTTNTKVPEEERYRLLEHWTQTHFNIESVVYKWSGQVMEPMDGKAFLGRNPLDKDNVYIITGDSGNGMTHCTIGGLLITDLITENKNVYEKIYKPSRFTLRETGQVFKQMMHEFISYLKQTPNFKGSDELANIEMGQGKLVDMMEERFGVYRHADGKLHVVSAQCTHLRCTVAWNADEKSWDCPCHGSRFTYEGKVINGPANEDLPYYHDMEQW